MRKFLMGGAMAAMMAMSVPALAEDDTPVVDDTIVQLADWLDYESVSNPQISPDGRTILYTRTRVDAVKDRRTSTVWMMNADGSDKRQLMEGGGALWSPDGARVLFVKSDADDKAQLFMRSQDGLITQLTHTDHAPRSMAWSPDGKTVAFVARVPKKEAWTIKLPDRPKGADWSPDPVIVDTLHYRQDRVGITNDGFDHIFTVSATGGTPRQVTEGDWNVGVRGIGVIAGAPNLAWSPDSLSIAFDGPGEALPHVQWWRSDIHVVDVKSGDTRRLTSGQGSWHSPAFAPDGRSVAYVGYPEHDQLTPLGDLYVMSLAGGSATALTRDMADTPGQPHFSANGKTILFVLGKEGARNIHSVSTSGNLRDVTTGAQVVGLSSLADDDTLAITYSRSDLPGAIATLSSLSGKAEPNILTDVNGDIFDGVDFGRVEEIWYNSTAANGDTARVQGWIVYPPDYDASQPYPMVLSIHGGPQAMYNSGFNFRFQEFAARGYVVLYVNPRGSTGYGEDFVNTINGQYPGQFDHADLMAGVDQLVERGIADPQRLFVMGCSGGGVLTTHVIAQTDRFAAAAALCPVTNWISMSGSSDVTAWLFNFFDKPYWEDPDPWIKNSTIMSVGNVSTPTLLMTGTEDIRTPIEQTEQYYSALVMRGVPTKLIPMPNEYHGTSSRPSNFLRTHLYLQKWFAEHDPTLQDETDEAD